MKKLVKTLEGLPWIIRVILTIVWGVYGNLLRLFRSLAAKNLIGVVLSVILLCTGGLLVLWIIDLIMVIFGKRVWWID